MRNLRNPFVQVVLWTLGIGSVLAAIVLTVPWLPEDASGTPSPTPTSSDEATKSPFSIGNNSLGVDAIEKALIAMVAVSMLIFIAARWRRDR